LHVGRSSGPYILRDEATGHEVEVDATLAGTDDYAINVAGLLQPGHTYSVSAVTGNIEINDGVQWVAFAVLHVTAEKRFNADGSVHSEGSATLTPAT